MQIKVNTAVGERTGKRMGRGFRRGRMGQSWKGHESTTSRTGRANSSIQRGTFMKAIG